VYREVKEKGCGYREAYARARAWMQAAMDDPYFWSPYVVYGE
jgi:CHAT domain-containing protein